MALITVYCQAIISQYGIDCGTFKNQLTSDSYGCFVQPSYLFQVFNC